MSKCKRFSLLVAIALILFVNAASAQWTSQPSGLPSDLGIGPFYAVNENIIWSPAGTFSRATQYFLKSVDGGKTWRVGTIPNASGLGIGSLVALDSSTAWVSTYHINSARVSPIFKTIDGGKTWTSQTTAFPAAGSAPAFVYFFDANNGVAVGDPIQGNFGIYITSNGGTLWTRVPSSNIPSPALNEWAIFSSYAAINNTIWFGTSKGSVYRSENRGQNWTAAYINLGVTFVHCAFQDENVGLATSIIHDRNRFARTTNGGKNWQILTSLPGMSGVPRFVPGTTGTYMLASDGGLGQPQGSAYTMDSGATWKKIDALPHGTATFASPSVGWSSNGNVIHKWTGPALAVAETSSEAPATFVLQQNYPNPFNPSTTIRYALPHAGVVTLKIFNVQGQELATLVHERQAAGEHAISWNAAGLPSGVYLYRLQAGDWVETKKMLLAK